jgi:hypothetical protein
VVSRGLVCVSSLFGFFRVPIFVLVVSGLVLRVEGFFQQ